LLKLFVKYAEENEENGLKKEVQQEEQKGRSKA
jgi:hypothetical protein